MGSIIEPRILKGFRDFLPGAEIVRRNLIARIEAVFRLYGFVPIDTPALEYAEILLGKSGGETEKQVYRFTDHGGRDVALRFDLTVPFARFLAEHSAELPLPFKRYHIAKVWRGENTQRGRYREFTQCDFDIVGAKSPAADFEILLIMHHVLNTLSAGAATIHINHRGLFNRFLAQFANKENKEQSSTILHIVDKIAKTDREDILEQLTALTGADHAKEIVHYVEMRGTFTEMLQAMTALSGGVSPESEHLKQLCQFIGDAGIADSFVLDTSITRGLDYYTGVVYESFLNDLPSIGSICSGGRYDNLTGLYSKESISGVGASVGLDRLIAALEALDKLTVQIGYTQLAIACEHEGYAGRYQTLASRFRGAGIPCEVFFEEAKLTKQYMTAEKKGIRWVLMVKDGIERYTVRDLETRENKEGLTFSEVIALVAH